MAGQRDITLHAGHATPKNIVLRALPVPSVPSTRIYLYAGHATPGNVILRDPTLAPAAPPTTGGMRLSASWGAATSLSAGGTFRRASA